MPVPNHVYPGDHLYDALEKAKRASHGSDTFEHRGNLWVAENNGGKFVFRRRNTHLPAVEVPEENLVEEIDIEPEVLVELADTPVVADKDRFPEPDVEVFDKERFDKPKRSSSRK